MNYRLYEEFYRFLVLEGGLCPQSSYLLKIILFAHFISFCHSFSSHTEASIQ